MPTTVLGCLLDVSGSMKSTLEVGQSSQGVVERLRAILRAALKLAQAEHRRDPNALMFVGVFGLSAGYTSTVDLCGVLDALVGSSVDNHLSGQELLIRLANEKNRAHITRYIETKLTNDQARVVHAYLRRHPEGVEVFVRAIPTVDWFGGIRTGTDAFGLSRIGSVVKSIENDQVDKSEAIKMAQRICDEWLMDFTTFEPRSTTEVIRLLQQLEEHPAVDGSVFRQKKDESSLVDVLRQYVYGSTPMKDALQRSLVAFRKYPTAKQRALVLVSDGASTDGDPALPALESQQANVTIVTVYLTDDESALCRRVFDRALQGWNSGQRTLFNMASRVAGAAHQYNTSASVDELGSAFVRRVRSLYYSVQRCRTSRVLLTAPLCTFWLCRYAT